MIKLVVTEDGSHTLYNVVLNEHYHSTFGAIQESKHIFIEAGLRPQIQNCKDINLLEVGFGTGLNAFLSLEQSFQNKVLIDYWGVEPFPVEAELLLKLNFDALIESKNSTENLKRIHELEWNECQELFPNFRLQKLKQKIEDISLPENYFNLVYFDAFAPDVQSELWSVEVFRKIYDSMKQDGILVTYSVKGTVKRALRSAGFTLEKLPGPIGKREFLRAKKVIQG